jgi:hypothetical protein
MNAIIRKLEIYNLIGIGDPITIEMANWLNNIFSNLNLSSSTAGVGYNSYSYNDNLIIAQFSTISEIYVDQDEIWYILKSKYKINFDGMKLIIMYYLEKYYNIDVNNYQINTMSNKK